MQRTLIVILGLAMCIIAVEAAQRGNTQGIPLQYAAEAEICLRLESRNRTTDGHTLEMRLINPTRSSLTFSGYSESSPWYLIQKWVEDEWEEHRVGWFCGTGLRKCEIPGGRSSVIPVQVEEKLFPIRVGVGFEHEGHKRTVWSDRIEAAEPPGES